MFLKYNYFFGRSFDSLRSLRMSGEGQDSSPRITRVKNFTKALTGHADLSVVALAKSERGYKPSRSIILFLLLPLTAHPTFDWQKEQHWDWGQIPHEWSDLGMPQDFQFGVASSAFHLEGNATDQQDQFIQHSWTESAKINTPQDYIGCNHWDMCLEDVEHIKNAGFTQYRLSIDMYRIMPKKGEIDKAAIAHYQKLIAALKAAGIKPWICLHHFQNPVWFEQEGGFLNQENITYFVQFCKTVFQEFNQESIHWATFNEPLAYAIESYVTGQYPPHYTQHTSQIPVIKQVHSLAKYIYGFKLAGTALKNMLEAHVQIYQACKKINPDAQIGIIHMFHLIHPYSGNALERWISSQANQLINDTTLDFFKTGNFNWKNLVRHKNVLAPQSLDFIGVNWYRHQHAKFDRSIQGLVDGRDGQEKMHDTGWALHPEGLYCSIKKAATLNLPIHVTEIGIADKTETQQDTFLRQHIYAIKKAKMEGIDVCSCFLWTLMEQPEHPAFGMYKVEKDTWKRTLRPGFKNFVEYMKQHMEAFS